MRPTLISLPAPSLPFLPPDSPPPPPKLSSPVLPHSTPTLRGHSLDPQAHLLFPARSSISCSCRSEALLPSLLLLPGLPNHFLLPLPPLTHLLLFPSALATLRKVRNPNPVFERRPSPPHPKHEGPHLLHRNHAMSNTRVVPPHPARCDLSRCDDFGPSTLPARLLLFGPYI